jgi:curved DNA-binding protein CbpA
MDTLYDLLGALPRDDAEDLRTAFRRAVKGAHPDLRPGDPDAGLKFRQIVRANEILIDSDQRAAYDHLLALARVERRSAVVHPVAALVHGLASAVMALAGAAIVTVACYLLFVYVSAAWFAPADNLDFAMRISPDMAAASPAETPNPAGGTSFLAKRESTSPSSEATAPSVAMVPTAMVPTNVVSIPQLNVGGFPDPAPNDARSFRARGISAYRNGDLNRAIADLDQAIQLDPNFSASYIDRSIVLYRLRQFDRAFADIARAKRLEKESRAKSVPATVRKPHLDQSGIAHPVTPQS